MFISPECAKYWTPDQTREVPYYFEHLDPDFENYIYGLGQDPQSFFRHFVRQVTTGTSRTGRERLAYAHPTGGRVHVYELPQVFYDPVFETPTLEMDAKGVLFTEAGFRNNRSLLLDPASHREIMQLKPDYNGYSLRGPHELITSVADRDMQALARSIGITAPLTVAIVVPEKIIYGGKLENPEKIKRIFGIPPNQTFAIQFRTYPGTSTRIADLLYFPEFQFPLGVSDHDTQSILSRFADAKYLFLKVELPRLQKLFPGISKKQVLEIFSRNLVSNTAAALENQLTPTTGEESSGNANHWHAQNITTTGAVVEWTPITDFQSLDHHHLFMHVKSILERAQEAWITMALATESYQLETMPNFFNFLKSFRDIEVVKSVGVEDAFSDNRAFQMVSSGDCMIEWLKSNTIRHK